MFLGLLLVLLGVVVLKKEELIKLYDKYILGYGKDNITIGTKNKYYRDYDFNFVQNTTNFKPESKQDILNIYYTAINAGKSSFTFYCPDDYSDCLKEIKYLANDQEVLSNINNFVHPYNGFKHIETEYDSLGKIHIIIEKSYTNADIKAINKEIDRLVPTLILSSRSTTDNIKAIHDYIINNSKYDSDRSDNNIVNYKSDIAYGPLLQGHALCGGYTDAMELFLEKMGVKSFKVSSENHVWNAVYVNNTWLNLDLTWDDPITSTNEDLLEENFFLITTSRLNQLEPTQHIFDQTIYSELKES